MIEYIRGELADLTPILAVVEVRGVGYVLNTSFNTYSAIQDKTAVKFYTHGVIMTGGRDDNYTLYGFANKRGRSLYRLLITASGVDANTVCMVLSSLAPVELCNAIVNDDEKILKTMKGIGLRTAQRIITDLKNKTMQSGTTDELYISSQPNTPAVNTTIKGEAVSALTMLSFFPIPSAKVVVSILAEQPDPPAGQVVKLALKMTK